MASDQSIRRPAIIESFLFSILFGVYIFRDDIKKGSGNDSFVVFVILTALAVLLILKELLIPFIIINNDSIKYFSWYKYSRLYFSGLRMLTSDNKKIVLQTKDLGIHKIYLHGISDKNKSLIIKSLTDNCI
jgi:hypothetical protein